MASNTSSNKNKTTRHDGSLSKNNSGHTTVKHSAVSNPVPGKGGKKGK